MSQQVTSRNTRFELEIAEITAVAINMKLWARLKLAQGEMPFFQ